MKKIVMIIGITLTAVLLFMGGYIVKDITAIDNEIHSVVGVYHNDDWNGDNATLILNEDGSCKYPSGGTGTWVHENNEILLTITSTYLTPSGSNFVTNEHKCSIVPGGIILHDHFFEKLN